MRILLSLFCLSIFIFSACTKNIDVDNLETPEYEPEFALPLINMESTVTDILVDADPNSYSVDENDLVTYVEGFFNIQRYETFAVDLSDIGESIKSMEYKMVVENGVPITGNVQLYFLDETGFEIDTLLSNTQTTIEPAPTNENGEVISTTYQEYIIPFDSTRVEQIKACREMAISSFFVPNNVNDKIFTPQVIKLRLGAKVVFDIEL